ncbi:MAG: enoyl-CoA hydratase [Chloroflexi bacterium]|nr:enoyl-CoA hydratase [Chloroflexota bacterium]
MAYEALILKREAGVATITLNRPDKLNALSPKLINEIPDALEEVGADKSVRAVVLTGNGRAFSAGAELDSPIFSMTNPADIKEFFGPVSRTVLAIRNMPKAVVAAVNGPAVGGAMNMVLACDIIIASETARFGEVFVNIGLQPDYGGTYLLPQLIGVGKAMELMLTGRLFDAKEAERLGIVTKVVPADKLEATAQELARKLADAPPLAVAFTKTSVYQAMNMSLGSALEAETRAQSMLFLTEDMKEGIKAFLEKRKPIFKGK